MGRQSGGTQLPPLSPPTTSPKLRAASRTPSIPIAKPPKRLGSATPRPARGAAPHPAAGTRTAGGGPWGHPGVPVPAATPTPLPSLSPFHAYPNSSPHPHHPSSSPIPSLPQFLPQFLPHPLPVPPIRAPIPRSRSYPDSHPNSPHPCPNSRRSRSRSPHPSRFPSLPSPQSPPTPLCPKSPHSPHPPPHTSSRSPARSLHVPRCARSARGTGRAPIGRRHGSPRPLGSAHQSSPRALGPAPQRDGAPRKPAGVAVAPGPPHDPPPRPTEPHCCSRPPHSSLAGGRGIPAAPHDGRDAP